MKLLVKQIFALLLSVSMSVGLAGATVTTVISPYSPGGGASAMIRFLAAEIEQQLGTAVVVDYRAGADGRVAATYLRNAGNKPIIMVAFNSTFVDNKEVTVGKDIVPIAFIGRGQHAIAVRKDFPYDTFEELLNNSPVDKRYFYGTAGIGSSMHLTMLDINSLTNRDIFDHVPYKGNGPALIDLLGGRIDLLVGGTATVAAHVQSGDLKVLGTLTQTQSILFPGALAIGYDRIPSAASVMTIFVNASVDPATIELFTNAITNVIQSPQWDEFSKTQGIQPYVQQQPTILLQTLDNIRILEEVTEKNRHHLEKK